VDEIIEYLGRTVVGKNLLINCKVFEWINKKSIDFASGIL
jgi:hypothetical protein